jgi:hypothetical protein
VNQKRNILRRLALARAQAFSNDTAKGIYQARLRIAIGKP